MIAPASTVRSLIEGRFLGAPPIWDILEELPIPSRDVGGYFTKPMSLSPALDTPTVQTHKNQGSNQPVVVDAVDTSNTSIEDSARRLAELLKTRRVSNLKVAIYGSAEDSTLHAARTVAKHLKAFKPTVETLPALALQGSEPKEHTQKYRSRILGAIETMLNETNDTDQLDIVVTDADVVNLVQSWIHAGATPDHTIDSRWLNADIAPGQLSVLYTQKHILRFRPDLSAAQNIPRSAKLLFVCSGNTNSKE